jgi:drug/metabolite transporter (DMT)-like permease
VLIDYQTHLQPSTDNLRMHSLIQRLRHLSPKTVGLLAAVVTVSIWSTFIVIARASASFHLLPLDIAWARMVGAGLVLLPWGWWLTHRARASGESMGSFGGLSPLPLNITVRLGFFGGLGYAMLAYSGFFFAPAAHGSVLMPCFLPVWTSLLALALLGERLHGNRLMGLFLIISGGMLVGGSSLLHAFDGGTLWVGDMLFLSASFCWSTYSVLSRRLNLQAIPATIAITCFAFFSFVPLYTLLAWYQILPSHLFTAPLSELMWQALFQGGGSVVISGITFTQMIRYFGPVRSTMITSLVPGLSALGAVVFLGEPLGWHLLTGLTLVTAGILFGVQKAPANLVKA